MANNKTFYTDNEKIQHFSSVLSDPNSSQGQRDYAARRLKALTGNGGPAQPSGSQCGNYPKGSSGGQRGNYSGQRGNYPQSGSRPNVLNVYVHNVKGN